MAPPDEDGAEPPRPTSSSCLAATVGALAAALLVSAAPAPASTGNDPTAIADAAIVLDWALSALGRGDEAAHLSEALAIVEGSG